jgi:hypothetical protein
MNYYTVHSRGRDHEWEIVLNERKVEEGVKERRERTL